MFFTLTDRASTIPSNTYINNAAVCILFHFVVIIVFFAVTDRASTLSSIFSLKIYPGYQSGTWYAVQVKIRGTSTKLQREQHENKNKTKNKTKTTARK